jgi:tetratricopeptide (TPR) repeat protein
MTAQLDAKIVKQKFAEFKNRYPTEPEDRIWASVAEAFDLAGRGPETIVSWENAIRCNPEWGKYHLSLAKAYLRGRQWLDALASIEACADLDSTGLRDEVFSENLIYYLGYALFGAGRFKEAAEAWKGADNAIQFWGAPEPLKDFHLHRGLAHHLEGDFLDAIEAYRRGLVSPGPGDCALDDDMNPDDVEAAQDRFNPRLEEYHDRARAGHGIDPSSVEATPYTS